MPRAGLSTQAVVDLALEVVDKVGLDGLTLSAVAQRAGVATPSLYKHVSSLDALLHKVSVASLTELSDLMAQAASGRAGVDALRSVASAYRGYASTYPRRYPATQRVPDLEDPAHVLAADRAVGTMVSILIGYGISGPPAIDATRFIRSAIHGFVSLEVSGGFGIPQDLDHSFAQMIDGIDAALRGWTDSSPEL